MSYHKYEEVLDTQFTNAEWLSWLQIQQAVGRHVAAQRNVNLTAAERTAIARKAGRAGGKACCKALGAAGRRLRASLAGKASGEAKRRLKAAAESGLQNRSLVVEDVVHAESNSDQALADTTACASVDA